MGCLPFLKGLLCCYSYVYHRCWSLEISMCLLWALKMSDVRCLHLELVNRDGFLNGHGSGWS